VTGKRDCPDVRHNPNDGDCRFGRVRTKPLSDCRLSRPEPGSNVVADHRNGWTAFSILACEESTFFQGNPGDVKVFRANVKARERHRPMRSENGVSLR